MIRVKPPCMIIVRHVLPAMRLLIMKDLIEKHKLRKIDVSTKMELTPAAITHYLQGKRGGAFAEDISRSKEIMDIVADIADIAARGDSPTEVLVEKMCEACSAIRSSGAICQLHKEDLHSLEKCTVCR
jgi:predicted transcriptional regulator